MIVGAQRLGPLRELKVTWTNFSQPTSSLHRQHLRALLELLRMFPARGPVIPGEVFKILKTRGAKPLIVLATSDAVSPMHFGNATVVKFQDSTARHYPYLIVVTDALLCPIPRCGVCLSPLKRTAQNAFRQTHQACKRYGSIQGSIKLTSAGAQLPFSLQGLVLDFLKPQRCVKCLLMFTQTEVDSCWWHPGEWVMVKCRRGVEICQCCAPCQRLSGYSCCTHKRAGRGSPGSSPDSVKGCKRGPHVPCSSAEAFELSFSQSELMIRGQ